MSKPPAFAKYIGIDYSGAQVATSSLKNLRVYVAEGGAPAIEAPPPPSLRKYWSRKGIADWLVEELSRGVPAIVGIDHGFAFPKKYSDKYSLRGGWDEFLDDFCEHWPTDQDHTYVDFIRDQPGGPARVGMRRWRRRTEERVRAKSVFHFDVQGTVAKSTHAGLPWLRFIRRALGASVHMWPFDGWDVPSDRSVVLEVYPRLWNTAFPAVGLTDDQRDARAVACWLQRADQSDELRRALNPELTREDRALASVEGWILGSEGYPLPIAKSARRRKALEIGRGSGLALAFRQTMPEISRFFGIVIAMFYTEHGAPHFHARYGEYKASIEIETGTMHGSLPPRVTAMLVEWREQHAAELLQNWQRARQSQPLEPVPPLE